MSEVLVIFQICLLKYIPFMEIDTSIGSKFKCWICLRVFDWLFLKLIVGVHPSLSHWCDRWCFRNIWDSHSISIDSLRYWWSSTCVDLSLSSIHVNCVGSKYSRPLNRRPFPRPVNTQSSLRGARLCSIKFLWFFNNQLRRGTACPLLYCLPHAQYFFIDDANASLCFNLSIF